MSTKLTAKGASSTCESSAALKNSILRCLPRFNNKQLGFVIEIMQVIVTDKKDVYFIICCEGKTTYQGYSAHKMLSALAMLCEQFAHHARSRERLESHLFLCVYPNNLVSTLSGDEFPNGGVL